MRQPFLTYADKGSGSPSNRNHVEVHRELSSPLLVFSFKLVVCTASHVETPTTGLAANYSSGSTELAFATQLFCIHRTENVISTGKCTDEHPKLMMCW